MRRLSLAIAALAASPGLSQSAIAPFEAARSAATTPGSWTYRASMSGSEAWFAGRFLIRCDRATRRVSVQRTQPVTAPPAPLVITTDSVERSLPAAGASLTARDPLLDAIAFSRGRFVVAGGGGPTLVVPAWPEAARSIEDCRN